MEVIEELAQHPLVIMAARIGRMFRVDPVLILDDGGDELPNLVRNAAALVVNRDEEKEAERMRSQTRRKR